MVQYISVMVEKSTKKSVVSLSKKNRRIRSLDGLVNPKSWYDPEYNDQKVSKPKKSVENIKHTTKGDSLEETPSNKKKPKKQSNSTTNGVSRAGFWWRVALFVVSVVLFAAAIVLALISKFVPLVYIGLLVSVIFLLELIAGLLLFRSRKKITRSFGVILTILLIAAGAVGVYVTYTTVQALNSVASSQQKKKLAFSLVVLKDSELQKAADITDQTVSGVNKDSKYLEKIKVEHLGNKSIKKLNSYEQLTDSILGKVSEVVVLNEAYREIINETYKDFDAKTRVIATYTYEEDADQKVAIDTSKSFNIYISGIDTYGSLSVISRSDVNMIATINAKTNKVLLTTVPRDSYVTIPEGGMNQKDKLTHAGIYGVSASMGAMEQLFDIETAGYVRVNFTAFMNIIDEIGGITVDNPIAFNSQPGIYFPKGEIKLDGKSALAFARERKNLVGGDDDRGKNQQRVISAIIKKLTSAEMAFKLQDVLRVIGQSVDTNINQSSFADIIRQQADVTKSWEVTTQSVAGSGSTGVYPSFAMPSAKLYMVQLNSEELQKAKGNIISTINQ